jgi:integrase
MLGGVYSSQKCSVCESRFEDDGKRALVCPSHPHCQATKFFVRFKGIFRRFSDYRSAQRFLTGLRYESDKGSFDVRDYRADQPLGVENLSKTWLKHREQDGVRCMRNLKNHIGRAVAFFGNRSVRDIGYGDLEDFRYSLPKSLSNKTVSNIFRTLHSFWVWAAKREDIKMPEFPKIEYELGWRKIIDKETQGRVLAEVRRISWHINPKIYIGCLWLSTYVNVRPIELIHVRESDFDLANGIMYVRHNKERRPKKVYLLPEDVELIKSFPQSLHPNRTYFFRHGRRKRINASKQGQFGKDHLANWWRKACTNIGIEGVPLYPGTRHSSVVELGDFYTPEEIMGDGTGHRTHESFSRYFKLKAEKRREIAAKARRVSNSPSPGQPDVAASGAPSLNRNLVQQKSEKVIEIQKVK